MLDENASINGAFYYVGQGQGGIFRIFGHEGSQAETFAKNNEYIFVPFTDNEYPYFCGDTMTWDNYNLPTDLIILGGGEMNDYDAYTAPWSDDDTRYLTFVGNDIYVGDYSFYDCDTLSSIDFNYAVDIIGDYSFYDCDSLQTLTFPDGTLEMGDYAFANCDNLSDVIIYDRTTQFGENVFARCAEDFTIHAYVGSRAHFYAVKNNINFVPLDDYKCGDNLYWQVDANGVLTISGTGDMYNYDICAPWYYISDYITKIVVEEGVTSIGDNAMSHCRHMTTVEIADSVTSIGDYAFAWALELEEITFGVDSQLETIGKFAFWQGESLTKIYIPGNVISIGEEAFTLINAAMTDCVVIIDNSVLTIDETWLNAQVGVIYGYLGSSAESFAEEYDIRFIPFDGIVPELRFDGKSVSLESNLAINYYVKCSRLKDEYTPFVEIIKTTYSKSGPFGAENPVKIYDYKISEIKGEKYYVFTYSDIKAYEMSSKIEATLYASTVYGETFVGDVERYSIKQYAMNQLSKSANAQFNTLLVDLLNYGAAAQIYFKYNTNNLANADLTEEQKGFATETMKDVKSKSSTAVNENAAIDIIGCSLMLNDRVETNISINKNDYDGRRIGLTITYTNQDGESVCKRYDPSNLKYDSKNDRHYVTFSDLNANEMRTIFTIAFYDWQTGELISNVRTYSIESYVASQLAREEDGTDFYNLLVAMMKYGDSAAAYFG